MKQPMINNSWDKILEEEYQKTYFINIHKYLGKAYANEIIYPPKDKVYSALRLTPYEKVKVVILGQDPYHGVGEANGLAFSVNENVKLPPSLRNIYKELYDDLKITINTGDLSSWAREGVLMLNSILTVKKDTPSSHKNLGWEIFTNEIIKKLNEKQEQVVFILWGNYARSKKNLITNPKHLVIESTHPSPFSAHNGFFGSKPFSKANNFLIKTGQKPINWGINK